MGEMYEIAVTTSGGLYRYCMGDIINVLEEGNKSEPPVIDVLGRKKFLLSIFGEKVTDYQLAAAITAATGPDGPWNQIFIQGYMMMANVSLSLQLIDCGSNSLQGCTPALLIYKVL